MSGATRNSVRLPVYACDGVADETLIRWLTRCCESQLSDRVAREAGAIDNAAYRDLNKVDALSASAALRRLRDAGLLSQHGRGSATWYQPTESLIGEDGVQDSESECLSSKFDGLSSKSGLLSSKLESLSSNPESMARNALLDRLPGQLAARVGALGQRHPPEQVRDLIVALCQHQAWKVEELALMLSRNPETIRQNYLRPLLAQKRIVMTLPDTPNSPQQAYRSLARDEE